QETEQADLRDVLPVFRELGQRERVADSSQQTPEGSEGFQLAALSEPNTIGSLPFSILRLCTGVKQISKDCGEPGKEMRRIQPEMPQEQRKREEGHPESPTRTFTAIRAS